ncbi:MAG TPA: LysE family transporter [Flavobacteriaceae bacterium]|nr:LysE family transporter [Flavobacteriaceae bacterium]
MTLLFNFLIGLIASVIGTVPPGLLNLYAVKVNVREGAKKALLFSLGVCVSVAVYSLLGLLLARYIQKHPGVVDILQKVALLIFGILTFYFLVFAKDTRREIRHDEIKSKTRRFFNGILIGALNLLIFPYWVYISLTFSKIGWLNYGAYAFWLAVAGAIVGTFLVLMGYVKLSNRREGNRKHKINFNLIIGVITAFLTIFTLGKILKWF